mmetsp:Transcript_22496/g.64699  ORF Transcript_22496/g.64699 Transcript_22496/m.64699 type:complete len:519 (-) Transcript_22496:71-1627(-)
MRIITGDECGLLKETIPEASRNLNPSERGAVQASANCEGVTRLDGPHQEPQQQTRRRGIVGLAKLPSSIVDDEGDGDDGDNSSPFAFAALRVDGTVETWASRRPVVKRGKPTEFATYHMLGATSNVFANHGSEDNSDEGKQVAGRPIGICSSGGMESSITACVDSMGRLTVLDMAATESDKSVVAQYNAFAGKSKTISYTKGNFANNDIATALAMDADASRIAVSGRERETTLLDVETGDILWKAKNLKPDLQTLLQHPIWTSALDFVSSDGDGMQIQGSTDLLAAGTAYKQFRIYDVRASSGTAQHRRPILCTKEGALSHRVTALCQLDSSVSSGYGYVIGDASGDMHAVDLRSLGKGTVGRYAGPGGSIRKIEKHPTLPILACVSLDRMLRTFDTKKRKMLDCVYLKQRLGSILFCDDPTWSFDGSGDNAVADDGEEEGDINMEDEVEDYVDSEDDVQEMRSGFGDDSDDDGNLTASSEEQDDESSDEEDVFAAPTDHNSKRGRGGSKPGQKKKRR